MKEKAKEWREQWNDGYIKFVPELFEMVEELEKENKNLNKEISELYKRLLKYEW